jgi:hypothetical protein
MRMEFGNYLYEPKKVDGFDFDVYRLKPETGRRGTPQNDMWNNIAVFGDNVTGRAHPEWISESARGRGVRGNNQFNLHWDVLCPTVPEFREEQLDYIEKTVEATNQPIFLNSWHFADHGHCTCERCNKLWKESGLEWFEWRNQTITEFIKDVKDRVKTKLVLAVLPDPANADQRFGMDFPELYKICDAFNIVMFSQNYATSWYWEMLARAFRRIFPEKPVYSNVYVCGPGDDPNNCPTTEHLIRLSVRVMRTGIDGIIYLADVADNMVKFQKAVTEKGEYRDSLSDYGGQPALDLFNRWDSLF